MAQCSEISLMLGPFEDGELEPHEMQEVARHLALCADCEQLLEEYRAIGRELRDLASQAPLPASEEFAMAVDARLQKLRLSWRERFALVFDGWNGQLGAAFGSMVVAASAAILTVFLMTPLTRTYFNSNRQAPTASLAQGEIKAGEQRQQLASAETPAAVSTPGNSQTIISRLESNIPSVALWSAPQDGTTVIWLPDQTGR